MKKLNRVLTAVLCAGLAASLMSCGGKKEAAASGGGSAASGDASSSVPSKHVVIQYMTTGNKPTNGATEKMLEKLNAILNEKCNAELQIYYIPWTDYLTNYNLTLA
ncbi:MAG: hypothetical protein II932_06070 [Treponema sp.]|nr:hypothetical protein [Treponema sp.]